MTMQTIQEDATSTGIRIDTRQFDTLFLRRNWISVVIQEVPGGRYWECQGHWTGDLEAATRFASCAAAMAHASELHRPRLQLVLLRESRACGVIPFSALA